MATRARRKPRGRTGRALWGASDLQRRYREILDAAKGRAQIVRDSDGSLLVVETEEASRFERELAEHLAEVAQFQRAFAKNRSKSPKRWAYETPYPYLAALARGEVEEFAKELLSYTLDAAQRGTLESLRGNLRAWQSTAEIYENQEELRALTGGVNLAEVEEVRGPQSTKAAAQ